MRSLNIAHVLAKAKAFVKQAKETGRVSNHKEIEFIHRTLYAFLPAIPNVKFCEDLRGGCRSCVETVMSELETMIEWAEKTAETAATPETETETKKSKK